MQKKYVYLFSEGNGSMRELMGGKGANLAEMTGLGMPVPAGFSISCDACVNYYAGLGALGGQSLHARHDGYDFESGTERAGRGGALHEIPKPPVGLGLLPPVHSDVLGCGHGGKQGLF